MAANDEKVQYNAQTNNIREANIDPPNLFQKLPDEILLHIISLLTPKEFIATRILAKKWLSLSPVLHLSAHSDRELQESLQSFSKQVLKTWSVSINLQNLSEHDHCIEDFLSLIAKNNIYELCFRCPNYTFPQTTYDFKSLHVLRLDGCNLDSFPNSTMTGTLESLHVIRFSNISFAPSNLSELFSISPKITHLSLNQCTGIGLYGMLDLSGLSKLKDVRIRGTNYEGIFTESPELCYLEFLSQCTAECLIVLRHCKKLEILKLRTNTQPLLCMEEIFLKCPLLEYVHMLCTSSSVMRPGCSKGISIRLDRPVKTPDEYSLEYARYFFRPFVFLMESKPQGKVRFRADHAVSINTYCFENLRELVQKARHVSVLSFRFSGKLLKEDVNVGEFRSHVSPVSRINHVKLDFSRAGPFPIRSCKNLVDAFLWCCYPETLTVKFNQHQNDFIKALCEKFQARGKRWNTCCKETDFKCWRHFLKYVEIEPSTRTNKQGTSFQRIDIRLQWS